MDKRIIEGKIATLRTAEGQVKALIAELVIAVTSRVHEHDDVDTANLFLLALSPLNQKKVLSFFKAFTGHKIEESILTKRLKDFTKDGVKTSPYQVCSDAFDAFKATNMTFWQWAVAKRDPEDKPLTIDEVTRRAKKAREVMAEAIEKKVVDKVQAVEMLLGGVMSMDDVMQVLAAMAKAEAAVSQAAKEPAAM